MLDGGVLTIHSVARPASPNEPISRSGLLATFRFASPAFDTAAPAGLSGAVFVANPVDPTGVGTPGFARAYQSDGVTVVADFSVGPGDGEIRLSEVSTTPGYPIAVTSFLFETWPIKYVAAE
ncbi:MAG TPA: hypothetical protein VGD75_02720 [Bradyrhizobium sp.]